MLSVTRETTAPPRPRSNEGAALVGALALVFMLAAAISVDVVRAGYKVKSDEATYVAMTLSLAYDGDLSYERRDLERFWGIYEAGPEGIFLKRGKQIRIRLTGSPPFVLVTKSADRRPDRLYFGKAMIYSIAAAPFVRLFGMNGFLVFHALVLFAACACGYLFLAARSRPGPALAFTAAFVGASVVPVYAVFLMPEIFNFSMIFVAYFLWLYKEVAAPRSPLVAGRASDLLAAVLIGVATYSKPSNAVLAVPLVLLPLWRRQWRQGFVVGVVFAAAAAALFGMNAAVTGDFNYQGGERKQFYSAPGNPPPPGAGFPFDAPEGTWEARGQRVVTNALGADNVLRPSEIVRLFGNNVKYFLVGRHFGFVPYFFPGAIALIAWAFSRERFVAWRVLTVGAVAVATITLLVVLPYTWSGGGGPPGNRYFMTIYPALFFIVPPLDGAALPLLAWIGGALFTAKMVVNPFYSAKFTWEATERGWARRLPVELTMANDLPVMLDPSIKARIPYGHDPTVLLYFLDRHAFPPEPDGMWISGGGRADIIVRAVDPIERFTITAYSPIRTTLTVSAGAAPVSVSLAPQGHATFDVDATSVRGLNGYASLLSARSSDGFTPRLLDPASPDGRNLGVMINFRVTRR
jgi:Glycosyltransferase family 87